MKNYKNYIHVLVVVFIYGYFLTDLRYKFFYHPQISLWLSSLPDFLGIAYGIVGILSIKRSLEQSKSYRQGVFYLIIGLLMFMVWI